MINLQHNSELWSTDDVLEKFFSGLEAFITWNIKLCSMMNKLKVQQYSEVLGRALCWRLLRSSFNEGLSICGSRMPTPPLLVLSAVKIIRLEVHWRTGVLDSEN